MSPPSTAALAGDAAAAATCESDAPPSAPARITGFCRFPPARWVVCAVCDTRIADVKQNKTYCHSPGHKRALVDCGLAAAGGDAPTDALRARSPDKLIDSRVAGVTVSDAACREFLSSGEDDPVSAAVAAIRSP